MSASDRVVISRLTSRSAMIWLAGTVALVLGVLAWVALTQPANRWAVAVGAALLVATALWLMSRRTWLDPASGTVVQESLWCRQRRFALRSASSLRLVDNRAGVLLLAITDGRTAHLPVLALTDYVRRSQPPPLLRMLAEQIDTWAPQGARRIAAQLRTQADFIAAGGAAERSPLAALVTHGVVRAAKAGGAGGLLD
jgi:hypothetical protein